MAEPSSTWTTEQQQQQQQQQQDQQQQNGESAAVAASASAVSGGQQKEEEDDDDDDNEMILVPQLSEHNITQKDLQTAVRVLNAVASLHRKKSKSSSKRKHQPNNGNGNNNGEVDEKEKLSLDDVDERAAGLDAYRQTNLRPLRKALAACLELHRCTMFQGKDEEEHYERQKLERSLKRQKTAERDMHKKYIASTALRQGRVERLQRLQQDGASRDEELAKQAAAAAGGSTGTSASLLLSQLVPDGHVETNSPVKAQQPLLLNNENNKGDKTTTTASTESSTTDPTATDKSSAPTTSAKQLPQLRSCYVCKVRYRELHHFYDQLCPPCAALNWSKRHQTADCRGAVAVVTGSRVKIGLQTCLKLLRSGATVVATTRFPNAAADVYRQQSDFETWKERLHVYGLDLRDVTGLEAFTRFLKQRFSQTGIDILINNACQTVRRPVAYYAPIVEKEQTLWTKADDTHKALLSGCVEFERVRRKLDLDHRNGSSTQLLAGEQTKALLPEPMVLQEESSSSADNSKPPSSAIVASSKTSASAADTVQAPFETSGLSHSAAMSQMVILPDDAGVSDSILPPGFTDINGQQLDLRTTNSWLLKMEEISTPEVMECMFVNAIAPFVLNSRLKPLMTIPNDDDNSGGTRRRPDRYVINVSAMEGKFYRYKMANHPHTNMAKAALNMLTRTSSEELAKKSRIYMNSVDTGWINDENPLERAKRTAETNLFQTPIDEIDAAARVLDPIFTGVNGGPDSKKDYGKFLKDYRESEW